MSVTGLRLECSNVALLCCKTVGFLPTGSDVTWKVLGEGQIFHVFECSQKMHVNISISFPFHTYFLIPGTSQVRYSACGFDVSNISKLCLGLHF